MKKILLIDDSADLRENVAELLVLENYMVLTFSNGGEGLASAAAEQPDLILCDVVMPDCDGFAVLERLKQKNSTMNIPVIMFTASEEKKNKYKGLALGAVDFITKPFDNEDLVNTIRCRILESEQKKQQRRAEILEYLQTLEKMLRMTSHSVRRPICSWLGVLQLLDIIGIDCFENENEFLRLKELARNNANEFDLFSNELTAFMNSVVTKYKDRLSAQA
jgi:DNA-binding response OmpR family regulator